MNNEKRRIYALDYIRAISAVLIILYHYTTQYENSIGHIGKWIINVPWGAWAVNIFFMLSGYLTLRNFREGGLRFLYKRFARLWPSLAASVLITSLFMFFMMPEFLRSPKDIILNLTMFPTYLGAKAVDGAYWTLPLELIFYWLITIFMIKKLRPHLLKIIYLWVVLMLAVSVFKFVGIEPLPIKALGVLVIAHRGECFVLGCAIALWQNGENLKKCIPLVVMCAINSLLNMGIGVTIFTICSYLLLLLIITDKIKFANKKPKTIGKCLVWFSGISYPVYLLHQYIGFAIIRKMELAGCVSEWFIFVPIVVTILLASCVHYLVELPGASLLLNLEKRICLRKTKQQHH